MELHVEGDPTNRFTDITINPSGRQSLFLKAGPADDSDGDGLTDMMELSNREFEVLRGISEGLSLKELGARLDISPKTISTYRDRVLQKLNARTNADLIRYAIRNLE